MNMELNIEMNMEYEYGNASLPTFIMARFLGNSCLPPYQTSGAESYLLGTAA